MYQQFSCIIRVANQHVALGVRITVVKKGRVYQRKHRKQIFLNYIRYKTVLIPIYQKSMAGPFNNATNFGWFCAGGRRWANKRTICWFHYLYWKRVVPDLIIPSTSCHWRLAKDENLDLAFAGYRESHWGRRASVWYYQEEERDLYCKLILTQAIGIG